MTLVSQLVHNSNYNVAVLHDAFLSFSQWGWRNFSGNLWSCLYNREFGQNSRVSWKTGRVGRYASAQWHSAVETTKRREGLRSMAGADGDFAYMRST